MYLSDSLKMYNTNETSIILVCLECEIIEVDIILF